MASPSMTGKIQILLCTPEYVPHGSGIAHVASSLTKSLNQRGASVDVLAPASSGFLVHKNKLPGILGLAVFWRGALRYARRHADRYNTIWLQQPFIIFPGVLERLGRPVILTWHATYFGLYRAHLEYRIWFLVPYYLICRMLEWVMLMRVSAFGERMIVTAVSPPAMEELRQNGCRLQVKVVPNASRFTVERTVSRSEARTLLRTKWGMQVADDDRVILSVGRVTAGKRPMELLKLFRTMQASDKKLKLVMVGGGALLQAVRNEARSMQGVFVPGYVPDADLPAFYRAGNLFMSLSPHEAFNLTAIEASSFGLEVALSDIASHRWLLQSGRVHGTIISASTSPSEVLRLMNSTTREADAGKAFGLTWDDVADSYLELIRGAMEPASPSGRFSSS